MGKVEYSVKCRIGNKGYVGGISLNAQLVQGIGVKVVFDQMIESKWRNSINFAISYFYESFAVEQSHGLFVEVINLSTLVVDTRQMVVFYVTLNCLCECFSIPYLINLDESDGKFVLKG
jgi:hypothetical protein